MKDFHAINKKQSETKVSAGSQETVVTMQFRQKTTQHLAQQRNDSYFCFLFVVQLRACPPKFE